jgi:hypothetical protein
VRSEAEIARVGQARAEGALQFVSQDRLPRIEPNPVADARPASIAPVATVDQNPIDLDEQVDPLAEISNDGKAADEKPAATAEKITAPTTQPTLANVLTGLLTGK